MTEVLNKNLFGFRKQNSWSGTKIELTSKIIYCDEEKDLVLEFFLDLRKEFNFLNFHKEFNFEKFSYEKMKKYDFEESARFLLNWFLSNSKHCVKRNISIWLNNYELLCSTTHCTKTTSIYTLCKWSQRRNYENWNVFQFSDVSNSIIMIITSLNSEGWKNIDRNRATYETKLFTLK